MAPSIRLTHLLAFTALFITPILGAPAPAASFQKDNAEQAQQQNAQFASLKATDTCTENEQACVESSFAQCVGGKWALTPCSSGTQCVALPLVNKPGTSIACDTKEDAIARMQAAGAS
ncbi:hypothetical protein K474DRAFT_1606787, partial [Panus rudis PR-1116 ss-1]